MWCCAMQETEALATAPRNPIRTSDPRVGFTTCFRVSAASRIISSKLLKPHIYVWRFGGLRARLWFIACMQGSKQLDELFTEYLLTGGNWSASKYIVQATHEITRSLQSLDAFIRYKDLVAKEGEVAADAIRQSKCELQARQAPDETPWIMKHPDLPGNDAAWIAISISP